MHLHVLLVALAFVQGCFIGGVLYSGWWSWGRWLLVGVFDESVFVLW